MSDSTKRPTKVISGGQTGVDRAALDWAISADIPHGGWCPKGRLAEDGPIAQVYQLDEMQSRRYADRTRKNVDDTDATLILYGSRLEGGTLLTYQHAIRVEKPVLKIRLYGSKPHGKINQWMHEHNIERLNIAGPRASLNPKIYEIAFDYLAEQFATRPTLLG